MTAAGPHLVELVLVVPDVLLLLLGRRLQVEVVPAPGEDLPPGHHPPGLASWPPGLLASWPPGLTSEDVMSLSL